MKKYCQVIRIIAHTQVGMFGIFTEFSFWLVSDETTDLASGMAPDTYEDTFHAAFLLRLHSKNLTEHFKHFVAVYCSDFRLICVDASAAREAEEVSPDGGAAERRHHL